MAQVYRYEEKRVVTVKDTAKEADCSIQVIYNLISQGELKAENVGKFYLIDADDWERLYKECDGKVRGFLNIRKHKKRRGRWIGLQRYLENLSPELLHASLTAELIRELTGTSAVLSARTFSPNMGSGKVQPVHYIYRAGWDIESIHLKHGELTELHIGRKKQ